MIAALVLILAAQAEPSSPVMRDQEPRSERLHIGRTGIFCVRLPCPSRGIFRPDEHGFVARDRLLYVDLDGKTPPPELIADEAGRTQIAQAWADHDCLAILGRLIPGEGDAPVLRVDRVLGSCRDHAE